MNAAQIAWEAVNRHHAMQAVPELAAVLDHVAQLGASRILEVGVHAGGTMWCWEQLGIRWRWGITLPVPGPQYVDAAGGTLLWADSHTPQARDWICTELDGQLLDVLHIDGDHSYDGALADWQDYHPMVRAGGLVLIHDAVNTRDCPDGTALLWAQLCAAIPDDCHLIFASGDPPLGMGVVTIRK